MARTTYGKTFRTRKGRLGRYKYVNGRKVSFEPKNKSQFRKKNKSSYSKYRYRGPR